MNASDWTSDFGSTWSRHLSRNDTFKEPDVAGRGARMGKRLGGEENHRLRAGNLIDR